MPTAFKDLNQSEDDKKSGSISSSDSTGSSWMENDAARSAHAVEVMRREQQTSWEQLRLNGARSLPGKAQPANKAETLQHAVGRL